MPGLPWPCPYCGAMHDSHLYVGDTDVPLPERLEIGLCIDCGETYLWEDGRPRLPTPAERAVIDQNPDVSKAQAIWRALRGAHEG